MERSKMLKNKVLYTLFGIILVSAIVTLPTSNTFASSPGDDITWGSDAVLSEEATSSYDFRVLVNDTLVPLLNGFEALTTATKSVIDRVENLDAATKPYILKIEILEREIEALAAAKKSSADRIKILEQKADVLFAITESSIARINTLRQEAVILKPRQSNFVETIKD